MYYLGIDPGVSGALAWYDPAQDILEILDMPVFEITVNRKKKRQLDFHQLASMVHTRADKTTVAMLEQVNALPKQGVTSSFNFGVSFGAVQMAVVSAGVVLQTVSPIRWKRSFNLTADKDASRRIASRLLPKHTAQWSLKKHDGRAEAALLALYAFRSLQPDDNLFS